MHPYRTGYNVQAATEKKPFSLEAFLSTACFVLVFLGLAISDAACTKTQGDLAWTVLKDSTGAVCPIVVQATAPGFAPLCVGLSELEVVIQGLTSAVPALPGDAGAAGTTITSDALYQAILQHRAAEAAKATK